MGMRRKFGMMGLLLALSLAIFGCNDNDTRAALEEAAAAAGFIIDLSGGGGTVGNGGDAGDINNRENDIYDDIVVSTSGSVSTGFTVPSYTPIDLGANGLTVTADTVVDVYSPTGADPAAGTPYMVAGNGNLFVSDGDGNRGDEAPVTGLQVNAGVTLTLGLNMNTGGNSGQDACQLDFWNTGDLNLLGTLKVKDLTTGNVNGATVDQRHGDTASARDMGSLKVRAYRLVMGSDGHIGTSGGNATVADTRGGDGGAVYLDAHDGGVHLLGGNSIDTTGGNGLGDGIGGDGAVPADGQNNRNGILVESDSVLINRAPCDASGGNGAHGGSAGFVRFIAESHLYNTATLSSNGGTGSAGDGGDSYQAGTAIDLWSNHASLFNSGDLVAMGGDGSADGGDGGDIDIEGGDDEVGNNTNSGNFIADGGSCTSANSGNGGDAGDLDLDSSGHLRSSGNLSAMGGAGLGAGSTGGNGGDLEFDLYTQFDQYNDENLAPGPLQVTGDIFLQGGSGESGGDGGDGGDFYIELEEGWFGEDFNAAFVGSITNRVAINARGGNGTTGSGGDGGYIEWETEGESYAETTLVRNSGAIDLSGGSGATGGDGGGLYWYGYALVDNSGPITATGGAATGAGASGGDGAGDDIEIYASFDIDNTADIRATGGDGTGTNGNGGDGSNGSIHLIAGGLTTNSGSIYNNGGNGSGSGENGSGGHIELFSAGAPTVNSAKMLTVAPGTGGAVAGENGLIELDWVDVTPADGTLP